jgi:hypothetical protein
MSELDMVVMIRVILSYVEDIHKGARSPGATSIRDKLRRYKESTVEALSKTDERRVDR